jgi:protein O-GlcNAc transferase
MLNLQAAINEHQQGHLVEAERLYRQLLAIEPENAEALHLLGYLAMQTGNWQTATDLIGRSLAVNPSQISAHLNLGTALRNLRRFDAALACCNSVLALAPDNAEALNNRGDVLLELQRPLEALSSLDKALRIQPVFPQALNNRGRALNALGKSAAALECFERALLLKPDFVIACNNRGNALRYLNRYEEALDSFDQALRLEPRSRLALYNRGNLLLELERHEEALDCYQTLLRLDPDDAESWSNRGAALMHLDRLDESLEALQRALALQPMFPRALNNLGNTQRKLRRLEDAVQSYDRALALVPDDADALSNRGVALTEMHCYEKALASHDRALALRKDNAELYCNRGNTRLALRQMQAALADYESALAIDGEAPDALFSRAVALLKLKRQGQAALAFGRVLQADSAYPSALGNRFHCNAQICDWTRWYDQQEQIVAAVRRGELADEPFSFLAVSGSAADQLQCAQIYMAKKFSPTSEMPRCADGSRIRVAYVSGDFRDHPVSRLLAGVFEAHDRDGFETVGISLRALETHHCLGKRVSEAFDRIVDVSGMSDDAVIALMRGMNIDIAVDLMGCTEGARTGIFAARAAPVQVNLIGFPGTLGNAYTDYLIADRIVVPEERYADYSECIASLPNCFQPNDDRREIAMGEPTRRDHGLPAESVVWACFNNPIKINPSMFDIWMGLLRATPGSVLWLFAGSADAERNLRLEASRRGVQPERIIFATHVPYEQHLARQRLADLFLDTSPFNGGTTVSDALWGGLPVLTYLGDAFAARMAGSLLHALGLPELVAPNSVEYEKRALEFVHTPGFLDQLRDRLRRARQESPLFNTQLYCRHLEAAYNAMHRRSVKGERAASFAV